MRVPDRRRCCSARAAAAARWRCCRPTSSIAAENAWLSPLPPEGASAIVHGDARPRRGDGRSRSAVGALDLLEHGTVHHVVPEPDGDIPTRGPRAGRRRGGWRPDPPRTESSRRCTMSRPASTSPSGRRRRRRRAVQRGEPDRAARRASHRVSIAHRRTPTGGIVAAAYAVGDAPVEIVVDPRTGAPGSGAACSTSCSPTARRASGRTATSRRRRPSPRPPACTAVRTLLVLRADALDAAAAPSVRSTASRCGPFARRRRRRGRRGQRPRVRPAPRAGRDGPGRPASAGWRRLVRPGGTVRRRARRRRVVGFHWTKVEDGVGEVYVVGVDPSAQGRRPRHGAHGARAAPPAWRPASTRSTCTSRATTPPPSRRTKGSASPRTHAT